MTNQQRQHLIDICAAMHWQLVGLFSKLEREGHRMNCQYADESVCAIWRDLQDELPHLAVDNGGES